MKITCFIRYRIDPFQREAFREYARELAANHPALRQRLILREERTFLENVR